MIYNAKDFLDQVDRILMANTNLDMTAWIYAIEGDLVLRIQEAFEARWLSIALTHFYVADSCSSATFPCFTSRTLTTAGWPTASCCPSRGSTFWPCPSTSSSTSAYGDVIPGMETIAYD